MSLAGGYGIQILHVRLVAGLALHGADNVAVLFLEHVRVNAVARLPGCVVLFIFGDLVDKEQGEHLDPLAEKPAFALDVRENRFPDLNAADLVVADRADHVACAQPDPVQKLHGIVPPVDRLHHVTVLVFFHPVGVVEEIEADPHRSAHLAEGGRAFAVELNRRGRIGLGQIDALQIDISVRRRAAGLGDALDGDFFDQALVVSFHRVQTIHHVVDTVGPVSRGIAQRQKRIELLQPLLRLLALDGLRLVDDQDRVGLGDNVDRPAGAELVQLHVNAPRVLSPGVERLRIDDHGVDRAVRGKTVDFSELGGVVDKETDLPAVLLGEVFLRHVERLVNALADRDAGNDDDELAPAVMLVQFVHRLDVRIRLADARLHLDRQIVASFQLSGGGDPVRPLNFVQLLQNTIVGKSRHNALVAPARVIFLLRQAPLIIDAPIHQIRRREVRLSGKNVDDRLGRVGLKLLTLEPQFHRSSPPVSSLSHSFSFFCRTSLSGKYNSYLEA